MTDNNRRPWRPQTIDDYDPGLSEERAAELVARMIEEGRMPNLRRLASELEEVRQRLQKEDKKS